MNLKEIKLRFLSFFREFFVYHHRSLEFRAKLFAAMIAARKNIDEKTYEILEKIGKEIYGKDEYRIEVLIRTTKEYVEKIVKDNNLNLDELIVDIDKSIKQYKRYRKKINMNHLKRLQEKNDESSMITQQRILEFAQSEIFNDEEEKTLTSL